MPPKVQKSKEAKLLAAMSASKSKKGKKKWSKGKQREKKNHLVVFNQALFDKFVSEVPRKQKVITIYSLVEQYKINCSLARRGIQDLVSRGLVDAVAPSGPYCVYTPSAKALEDKKKAKAAAPEKASKPAKGGKGKKQVAEDDE